MSVSALSNPQSICILRLSALGDITHIVPMVRNLQLSLPNAKLTWIIGKFEHKLVGDLPGVEFIVLDKKQGWSAYSQLKQQLKGRTFDVLMLCQVALRASVLSHAIRADVRIGFDWQRSKELHSWFINRRIPARAGQHVLDALGSFVEPLGLAPRVPRWNIPVNEQDRAIAEQLLPGDAPTLLISPCSSHALRNWLPERYAAIADYATQKHGLRVALVGGPSKIERDTGNAILTTAKQPILDLIGKDTLKQLLVLCERARVLLTPDSGPMHMANAVGTPVIGLHAATDAKRSGPYHFQHLCVNQFPAAAQQFMGVDASEVRWGKRIEFPGAMDLITVDQVVEKVDLVMR